MVKLSNSVSIDMGQQGEPYTLQFDVQIPKTHLAKLLNQFTNCHAVSSNTHSDSTDTKLSDHILEPQIASILHEVGIPAHIMGYRYLKDAITLSVNDRNKINAITKSIYPEVASCNNTTSSRVERAIRHAIEIAWSRGNLDILDEIFGYTVNPNSGRPTNSEFIALISDNLCMQNQNEEIHMASSQNKESGLPDSGASGGRLRHLLLTPECASSRRVLIS